MMGADMSASMMGSMMRATCSAVANGTFDLDDLMTLTSGGATCVPVLRQRSGCFRAAFRELRSGKSIKPRLPVR
jgi:hypothetical protein